MRIILQMSWGFYFIYFLTQHFTIELQFSFIFRFHYSRIFSPTLPTVFYATSLGK
uniref:Uncharacterized protein n=1 Tax=Parascaris univalens TaxID=6257 RepID=A0A914ZUV3_PARUN